MPNKIIIPQFLNSDEKNDFFNQNPDLMTQEYLGGFSFHMPGSSIRELRLANKNSLKKLESLISSQASKKLFSEQRLNMTYRQFVFLEITEAILASKINIIDLQKHINNVEMSYGHHIAAEKLNAYILPIYHTLKEQGFNHHDLTSGT